MSQRQKTAILLVAAIIATLLGVYGTYFIASKRVRMDRRAVSAHIENIVADCSSGRFRCGSKLGVDYPALRHVSDFSTKVIGGVIYAVSVIRSGRRQLVVFDRDGVCFGIWYFDGQEKNDTWYCFQADEMERYAYAEADRRD